MIRDKEGNDLTKQQPVLLYPLKDVWLQHRHFLNIDSATAKKDLN
jgi:hypothetical protein